MRKSATISGARRVIQSGRPHRSRQRGDAIIEAAITLIFFMSLLFGIEELARALYTYHFVSNAAREAVRWAAVNGSECASDSTCDGTKNAPVFNSAAATQDDVLSFVKDITPSSFNKSSSRLSISTCGTSGESECADSTLTKCATTPDYPGCVVQVKVNYVFDFLVPLVHTGSVTMSSTSEMVISH